MADKIVLDEIREQINSGLIQGAVVRTNLSEETIAMGVQAGNIPMSAESRFDIASTGKVFTAACVALLALDGKIDLDAPFTEYIPEHVLGKDCDITIRDLASHSSGFDNSKPYAADSAEEGITTRDSREASSIRILTNWMFRIADNSSCVGSAKTRPKRMFPAVTSTSS